MTRRAYLYFLTTFLSGILVGAVGMLAYAWYGGHWRRGPDKRHAIHRLKQELQLSEQQVKQVNEILDEFGRRFGELREQLRPQFDALREESHARVRALLTPEQQQKYDQIIRREQERRTKRPPPP